MKAKLGMQETTKELSEKKKKIKWSFQLKNLQLFFTDTWNPTTNNCRA